MIPGPESPVPSPTYYDRPLLKEPVWKLDIPAYYYLGGAAGAAFALGAAAQLAHDRRLDGLIRHCHWIGIVGSTVGGGLLVHDLGRPARFLNMLRVFRPTSPMNLGAWILAGTAPLGIVTGLFTRPTGGFLGFIGEIAGYGAGVFGTALAGYTGVVVGNTAIPVWQESRRLLPVLFYASSMASVASLLDLTGQSPLADRITFLFGTAGRVAELAAAHMMEKEASRVAVVGRPFREGPSGALWKAASVLTAASLIVSLLPNQSRAKRRTAGILGTIGAMSLRFAIHYAGIKSSRDPRASFQSQRRISAGQDPNV